MHTLQEIHPTGVHDPPHILVMEDEEHVAKGLKMVLGEAGYDVDLTFTGKGALEAFASSEIDLLVADLRLPDIDGMEVIRMVKERRPETEVVVITGYSTVSSAVDAMKIGVFDYLPKPFSENEIKIAVGDALKKKRETHPARIEARVSSQSAKLIQKREVIRALNRTAEDEAFWKDLMENGSRALDDYRLSHEAKAAIVSGDLNWINRNVGELTQKQLMFIYKRLEREAW